MAGDRGLIGRRDVVAFLAFVLVAGLAAAAAYVLTEPEPAPPTGTPVARITSSPTPSRSPLPATPAATPTYTPVVTPTATTCTLPQGWVPYVVQPGESLFAIALRYNLTPDDLAAANCLSSADEIQAGQQIYVPYPLTPTPTPCAPPAGWVLYGVQPGENMFRIALRYSLTAEQLRQANCLPSADGLQAGVSIHVPYLIPPTAPPLPMGGAGGQVAPPGGQEPATELLREIFFTGGGGGDAPSCDEPGPGVILPAIIGSRRLVDLGRLCLYGFPEGETGTVELYAPDDRPMGTAIFTVTAPFNAGDSTFEVVDLWWPVGLPLGTWRAVARTATTMVEAAFEVPPWAERAVSTVPSADVDPLKYYGCGFYQRGQAVFVFGTNHPPNRTLPLAVYLVTVRPPEGAENPDQGALLGTLVRSQTVVTDGRGDFSAVLSVAAGDVPGDYAVIPVLDAARQDYEQDLLNQRIGCYQVP